ncbi:hypothetical protein BJV74DRAFT_990425 [Russula compacta]|nr:hypothetical protein BJV74DRAFT_990425 [Russula compacta]
MLFRAYKLHFIALAITFPDQKPRTPANLTSMHHATCGRQLFTIDVAAGPASGISKRECISQRRLRVACRGGELNAKVIAAIVVPPLSNARHCEAHGQEQRARRRSSRPRMQLERDGERESVPRAVVRVGCRLGGTDKPRVRLGNGRPAVEGETRGDDSHLLTGDVADTHSAAEQRRPRGRREMDSRWTLEHGGVCGDGTGDMSVTLSSSGTGTGTGTAAATCCGNDVSSGSSSCLYFEVSTPPVICRENVLANTD